MVYEEGGIRSIRMGEIEILRRIYVAIRDRDWGTVQPRFFDVKMQVQDSSFLITYQVENQQDGINFAWEGKLHGKEDGSISFTMDGHARTTFWKNRIGFCVLCPAGCAGRNTTIEHTDGIIKKVQFPVDICSNQPVMPFTNLCAISQNFDRDGRFKVRFEGDVFEMEDQRLWTDASFKIYCTPLSRPYPAEIQAGTCVSQSIQVEAHPPKSRSGRWITLPSNERSAVVSLRYPDAWGKLPEIGLGVASHDDPLTAGEIKRLQALHLNHLRVDLQLTHPDHATRLRRASLEAEGLEVRLEIALLVTAEKCEEELTMLRNLVIELQPSVCRWLVYPAREIYTGGSPTELVLRAARKYLQDYRPGIPFTAGTNTDYIFLKRSPPPVEWMEQVCIAMNPQVHAFDNLSLVETLEAQPMVVESARRLANGLPVVVSPVTMKPRFNPYATGSVPATPSGLLPPQVDPRQASLFGAGWTLGSLRAMVTSKVESATYFETTGWRGVMERETGSPLPEVFSSQPGDIFPLYHILADVGEFKDGRVAALEASDGLKVSGLALRTENRERILLANHTGEIIPITMDAPLGGYPARFLDETTAEIAIRSPEAFRQGCVEVINSTTGLLSINLKPFGLVCMDK